MYYILLLPILYILYISYNTINHKYKQLEKLSSLTGKNNENTSVKKVLTLFFSIIFNFLKIYAIQLFNKNVIRLNKNQYILQFIIKGTVIKQIVTINSDPGPILQVLDDKNNDITTEIEPYFQNIDIVTEINPKMLNYNKLIFETILGDEKEFDMEDTIKLD